MSPPIARSRLPHHAAIPVRSSSRIVAPCVRVAPRLTLSALLAFALLAPACDDGSGGGSDTGEPCVTVGWRCASPACSQFPTNSSCHDVAPISSYCPLDDSHCFDPSLLSDYCDPKKGVCARARTGGVTCPAKLCTADAVGSCMDTDTASVLCRNGMSCFLFTCGAGDGGAVGDGGPSDMGDMSVGPHDLSIFD